MIALRGRTVIFLVLFFLVGAGTPSAEHYELSVPYDVHVPLLLKLVSKSRTLPERLGAEVRIAVCGRRSLGALREIADGKQLLGKRIRVIDATRARAGAEIIYVGPDAEVSVEEVRALAQATGAVTVTGVGELVEQGIALGVKLSPSHRPKILVNLAAARQQGIDLPAAVLAIAEVVER